MSKEWALTGSEERKKEEHWPADQADKAMSRMAAVQGLKVEGSLPAEGEKCKAEGSGQKKSKIKKHSHTQSCWSAENKL